MSGSSLGVSKTDRDLKIQIEIWKIEQPKYRKSQTRLLKCHFGLALQALERLLKTDDAIETRRGIGARLRSSFGCLVECKVSESLKGKERGM